MILQNLRNQLSELELRVVDSLGTLPAAALDQERSSVTQQREFLVCRFLSVEDQSCPFELHFGRGEYQGKFNFYVGRGAEFCNLEGLETMDDAAGLAEDLRRFLTSTVRCERRATKEAIVQETYTPSQMRAGDLPLKLTYKAKSGLSAWLLASRKVFDYRPWVVVPSGK